MDQQAPLGPALEQDDALAAKHNGHGRGKDAAGIAAWLIKAHVDVKVCVRVPRIGTARLTEKLKVLSFEAVDDGVADSEGD